jgi:hypothetical protein
MINPDDKLPVDDFDSSETDDQQSQQDIHSNGLNEEFDSSAEESAPPIDLLRQASDASEAAYTLDVERGIAPKAGDKNRKE